MANKFNLKVITPNRIPYEGEAEMVILPGVQGELAIMADHMPLVVALTYGIMTIRNDSEDKVASVLSGFAEVVNNQVTVTARSFEWSDEIDQSRAQADRERNERISTETTNAVEKRRAELEIRRATVRMEVSTYSIIKGRVGGS
ncbi:MAG: ATP synthase F1 subunit epsilon [Defluviitaleaceae bacterium]|nr:ATP synthase F1 subunit epsilon [Defluviitaleaceae bacterium]